MGRFLRALLGLFLVSLPLLALLALLALSEGLLFVAIVLAGVAISCIVTAAGFKLLEKP